MRKDWKYIVYVSLAVFLFVVVRLLRPQQFDWSLSLSHDDKNPYGTYALNELLPSFFSGRKITNSYETLYELKDSLRAGENVIIMAGRFQCEKEDTEALLSHVAGGATAFITAQYFRGHFSDTLNLTAYDYLFSTEEALRQADTTSLRFSNHQLDTAHEYWFKRENVSNYFRRYDTTRTTVIARNENGAPVTIRMKWGKGNLILNSTPHAFTNIYLLARDNQEFVAKTLSYLPARNVYWTEYYHHGRMESRTPLRFILTNEPLKWAYYIVILSIVLFMIFESRRKQRIIPIVKPPANTSLEFVSTIGNLFYQHGDHRNMAEKKISFLLDHIRTRYLLKTNQFNDEFRTALAHKSGHSREEVNALFNAISFITSTTMVSAGQLMDLNDKIEQFYQQR
jgi:hypothetical protein